MGLESARPGQQSSEWLEGFELRREVRGPGTTWGSDCGAGESREPRVKADVAIQVGRQI